MGFDLGRAWKVAQAVIGAADASRRALAPSPSERSGPLASPGVFGQLEARLTGVLVSALKEAFDRDAARLDVERAALEAQRLDLVRQAGDRALARVTRIGAVALFIWLVSVIFAMRFPQGLEGAGRVTLGVGWACLAAAL